MAVSEEELAPEKQPPKSVHYIAKTVLKGSAILHAGYGSIRSPFSSDIVLGKETSIELVVIGDDGVLQSICEQTVFGIIKDLSILRWNWACPPSVPEAHGKDLVVVLSDSGKLTFLTFSIKMHRFFPLAHIHLSQPGNPRHQLGRMLAVDPYGRFIAVAAYENQIAIFPISPSAGHNIVDKKILYPAHLEGSSSPTRDAEDSILGTIWSLCFVSRDFSHGVKEPYDPILAVIIHRNGKVLNELLLLEFNSRDSSIHVKCQYKEGGALFVAVDAVPHLPGFLLLFRVSEILLIDIRDPCHPQSLCKTSLCGLAPVETKDASSECCKTLEADEEGIFTAAACALLELSDSGMEISKDDPMTIDGESTKLVPSSCFVCTWSWEPESTSNSRMIFCTDDGELFMLDIDFDNLGSLKFTISACLYRGLPCKTLLWVKKGFVATFVEMGDGLILKLEDGRLFYQSSVQNICPILDVSVVDTHDGKQDQIFAACGLGPEGSLRIIRSGINIEKLLRTSPIYQGVTGIWSLRMKKHDKYHSFLVISFVEETRVLSVGVSFCDVTDSIGFVSDTCTLSCGLVEDGVLVQICKHWVRICFPTATAHPEGIPSSCPMYKSWRADGLTINLGAVGNNLIIVATSNPCYLFILGTRLSSTCNYEIFEIQNIKLQAEVSCISVPQNDFTSQAPLSDTVLSNIGGSHHASFPSGIEIGKTFVIGTHKPSVELLSLVPKEGFKVLAVGNISLANATGTILSWCIPQDVRIVLLDRFYVLSGLRNGMLLWFQWPVISSSSESIGPNCEAVDIPTTALPFATEVSQQYVTVNVNDISKNSPPVQLQLVALRRIGVTPVFLAPLSESLHGDIVALCDRPWLLQTARHSQRITYTSISFQPATHVAPVCSADCPKGILFVAENCLHLVELVNIKRLNVQKLQLGGTPRRILFHSETRTLLIMRTESSTDFISTSDICRVDPLSGFMNSCFKFDPGETPKCMQFMKVGNEQLLVVGTSLSLGRLIMPSGEAESTKGRVHVFCLENPHNSDSSSLALDSKSSSSAQLSSPFREIVGYATEELSNGSLCSSPDDNNLEGMKIEETETIQLRTVHLLKLPGAVLAVCPYLDQYLLLSASNILYVYGFVNENPQRLKKLASTRTRFVITCLTAHGSIIAVGDCRDGILFYAYVEDQNKLEQLYCDPCQRLVADCALLSSETAFVSDRRGSVSVLSCFSDLEDNACPEQNLTICCSYFMGETVMRVRKGFFSYRLPTADAKRGCSSSRSELPLVSSDHTVIACTLLGSVVIFIPLSREDHDLLEAVQAKLVVHPLTAPILGNVHAEFRGRGSLVGVPQILDGDMLSQFLELTSLQQQAVLSSDLTGSGSSKANLSSKSLLPVERVVQLLERLHNSLS